MRLDSRLSDVLHVLLHMVEHKRPMTSEALAKFMNTNAVVVRRTMAGLRNAGFVRSEKGHGGGWVISCDLAKVSLGDIHVALGAPRLFAVGNRSDNPDCLVEQAVNHALDGALKEAEELIAARFAQVSLADLSADFHQRFLARKPAGAHHV